MDGHTDERDSLVGKVAVISGSDAGIGAQIARELSLRGASIVVNYPSVAQSARAAELVASLPAGGIAIESDISTVDGPQTLVDAAVARYGRIDILVNNAAVAVNLPFAQQTLAHWDQLVNLNGRGVFLLAQAALPHLAPSDARIVNICSISARAAPPLQTIYAGTKGMVESMTRVWAKELPPKYGCTVNCVSPGPTDTEGFAAVGPDAMAMLQSGIDQTPVGPRIANPSEIAYAVLMLCLPRARWLNGVNLIASGGLYMV